MDTENDDLTQSRRTHCKSRPIVQNLEQWEHVLLTPTPCEKNGQCDQCNQTNADDFDLLEALAKKRQKTPIVAITQKDVDAESDPELKSILAAKVTPTAPSQTQIDSEPDLELREILEQKRKRLQP